MAYGIYVKVEKINISCIIKADLIFPFNSKQFSFGFSLLEIFPTP